MALRHLPRLAQLADLPAVQAVTVAAYDKYRTRMDQAPAPVTRDYSIAVEERSVWVVGDPVVGVICVRAEGAALMVENVAVHPSAQGRGVGRALMKFAEAEAVRRGALEVTLYTNEVMTENIAMYERLGYLETERRLDSGYGRVFMRKRLDHATPTITRVHP